MTRSPASWLLEDLLVARGRFAAARGRHERFVPGRRRPRRISQSDAARRNRDHHRDHLVAARHWFEQAGGDAAVDERGRQLARRGSRARLKQDTDIGHCLCRGRCPAREEIIR